MTPLLKVFCPKKLICSATVQDQTGGARVIQDLAVPGGFGLVQPGGTGPRPMLVARLETRAGRNLLVTDSVNQIVSTLRRILEIIGFRSSGHAPPAHARGGCKSDLRVPRTRNNWVSRDPPLCVLLAAPRAPPPAQR